MTTSVLQLFFARTIPSRPCRRMLIILAVWTCFCYVVFKVANNEQFIHDGGAVLPSSGGLAGLTGKKSTANE